MNSESEKKVEPKTTNIEEYCQKLIIQINGTIQEIAVDQFNFNFEQPYCRIQNLIETGLAQRQTASTYLKKLCEIGVLQEVSVGKEKLFVHPKLMKRKS